MAVVAWLGVQGCSPPVVGEWVTDGVLGNGAQNDLITNDDQSGSARIYATPQNALGAWSQFDFSVVWEQWGDEFNVHLTCKGACTEQSFKMTCSVIAPSDGSADRLDCLGEKQWANYPFDWARAQ